MATKINENERKVLGFLVARANPDAGFYNFHGITTGTELDRATARRACRSLKRKGLTEFQAGLWHDDGEMAGAGYGATRAGIDFINTELQEPTPSRLAAFEGMNKDAALVTQKGAMK